jgi:exonuclease SbcC
VSELLALGASHKTAPLSLRERIALPEGRAEALLGELEPPERALAVHLRQPSVVAWLAARAAAEQAERAQRELARVQARLDELQREKRLNEELIRALSDIRTDLNQALRPEISAIGSEFLTELTDARYNELELDESFHIRVLEDGVPKPVISGGEEDLANLVFRLAISQLIAERAGQPFSLLILDEVFGSLDESRRHNVIELLRRLRDRFEQVIVITHIESVRDGLDRMIALRYDEETGASVVEQADAPSALLFEGGELEGAVHESAAAD